MRGVRATVAVVVALSVGVLAIWGYVEGRKERALEAEREQPVNAPLRVSSANGGSVLTLEAAAQRASGIAVATLHGATLAGQRRAYGSVLDLQALTDLSNSYVNARAQLQTAQARLGASRAAFERYETLYKSRQMISATEFQTQEAAFHVDEAANAAAESQVRTIAATALQTWGPVLARALEQGSSVLTRLIGHEDVLIQVTLPASEMLTKPPVTAFIQGDEGSHIKLQYVSSATKTDPNIQGISFFYLALAGGNLLPGMKLLVVLPSDTPVHGMVVPAVAVVWWQGRAWVYRRSGPQTFTRYEIATDTPAPDGGYVVTGLPNEAEYVTQGAQLLLSEELRSRIQVGDEGG